MLDFIHPDYDAEGLPLLDIAHESQNFTSQVNWLAEDLASHPIDTSKAWLGTLLVNGKECQVQLVVTSAEMIDEG
ncbi:hypothetical protein [Ponticaulis sp.]|uniref:hypothetical protein n=1 Tax=Ponticaulis sp. TaxID=2020902 RepID=UPI000C3BC8E3|nr:hypothetical protein [Ponticaulis sp.]MAP22100.1 hypothetical protein [Alteromonadaceae bacterium]MAX41458.1 hypothetical protein [Alteromonadaceae bacterium]HBY41815.1 hypothetical protein [Alteromonas sp.]|tara:strand:+ start:439 stop:663 length:225 start_codon:yes stop_codon:yes gene_type:complete